MAVTSRSGRHYPLTASPHGLVGNTVRVINVGPVSAGSLTAMINLDQTRSAVAVEYLLDIALDAVPDLTDQALDDVA